MNRIHRKSVMAIITTSFFLFQGFFQQLDYKRIFGKHYQSAEDFISTHVWIADSLKKTGINPCTGLAVIFPELIRYSSIRDKIETAALQSLYIQYGKYYADFSIGYFQMKPSFAEGIEKEHLKYAGCGILELDTANTAAARKARIKRLSSLEGQVRYLCLFMVVMKQKLPQLSGLVKTREVVLLSAAYNHDYKAEFIELESISKKNFFFTGIIPPREKYNYSDIALDFMMKNCGTK